MNNEISKFQINQSTQHDQMSEIKQIKFDQCS